MGLMCCRNSRGLTLQSNTIRSAAATANVVAKLPEPDNEMRERTSSDIQWRILEEDDVDSNKTSEAIHSRALHLWRTERCHEALAMYERLHELELDSLGKLHTRTINTNENRAHLLHAVGRHEEALALFEDVVMDRTLLLGRDHTDTLAAKLSQAALLERMTRQSESLLAYDEALRSARSCASPQQEESAMRGRARLLFEMGRYSEALHATEQVLQFLQSVQYPHSKQDMLTLMRNRAQCLQYTGQKQEAIATYREVLRLQQGILGMEHRETLTTVHSLAVLLDMCGEREEAGQLYERLLQAWRAQVTELSGTLGERHPRTLQAKSALASVMQSSSVTAATVIRNEDDFSF